MCNIKGNSISTEYISLIPDGDLLLNPDSLAGLLDE